MTFEIPIVPMLRSRPCFRQRLSRIVADRAAFKTLARLLSHSCATPRGGSVAGDLAPIDSFQIAAAWAASAYPADVWLSLSTAEQSAAIYREMRKLDMAYAAPSSVE